MKLWEPRPRFLDNNVYMICTYCTIYIRNIWTEKTQNRGQWRNCM